MVGQALVLALMCLTDDVSAKAKHTLRFSDKIRELTSSYPETKILENKLSKLAKLRPAIQDSLNGIDKFTDVSGIK